MSKAFFIGIMEGAFLLLTKEKDKNDGHIWGIQ
jgi:hypothetical protein